MPDQWKSLPFPRCSNVSLLHSCLLLSEDMVPDPCGVHSLTRAVRFVSSSSKRAECWSEGAEEHGDDHPAHPGWAIQSVHCLLLVHFYCLSAVTHRSVKCWHQIWQTFWPAAFLHQFQIIFLYLYIYIYILRYNRKAPQSIHTNNVINTLLFNICSQWKCAV